MLEIGYDLDVIEVGLGCSSCCLAGSVSAVFCSGGPGRGIAGRCDAGG